MDTYKAFMLKSLPYLLCFCFLVIYTVLAFVRHSHYQSFGYDLGINDQVVWRYSHFQIPLTTIDPYPEKTKFAEHIEFIYAIIAPFYWLWSSAYTLLFLQNAFLCFSAMAVYFLARKYQFAYPLRLILMIAYLMFYGVQFSLWTDVHSSVFAAALLMWFVYCLDLKKYRLSILFFLLVLTAKESTGTALFFISGVYFWYQRKKILLLYMILACLYVSFVFFIFFPFIMHVPYLYANQQGLLSNVNIHSLVDTSEKQQAIFYSFASWGFLPFLSPLVLLPIASHFFKFFVLASELTTAHSIFGHYRIGIAPFLMLATMWTIKRVFINRQLVIGMWLLTSVLVCQYVLHLPLSYVTKQWFWHEPSSVRTINTVIQKYLPQQASVVSQNNITPHISQRDKIYTLYPDTKIFTAHSPCGKRVCDVFRWDGNPVFLIIDMGKEWDIRHFLMNRDIFLQALHTEERRGRITKYRQIGTTILYKVLW